MIGGSLLVAGNGLYPGVRAFGLLPSQHNKQHMLKQKNKPPKLVDHYFKVSSGVPGVSALTLATFPAAHILAIPPLLYTLVPVFADAYDGLKKSSQRHPVAKSFQGWIYSIFIYPGLYGFRPVEANF